jgi:hypothetical protein
MCRCNTVLPQEVKGDTFRATAKPGIISSFKRLHSCSYTCTQFSRFQTKISSTFISLQHWQLDIKGVSYGVPHVHLHRSQGDIASYPGEWAWKESWQIVVLLKTNMMRADGFTSNMKLRLHDVFSFLKWKIRLMKFILNHSEEVLDLVRYNCIDKSPTLRKAVTNDQFCVACCSF